MSPLPELPTRRQKILQIDANILLSMLHALNSPRTFKIEGLPEDARCVGMTSNQYINTVTLLVESAEWEPIPHGHIPPDLDLTVSEIRA